MYERSSQLNGQVVNEVNGTFLTTLWQDLEAVHTIVVQLWISERSTNL